MAWLSERAPTLSDVLAVEREHVARGGSLGLLPSRDPTLDELRELHGHIVARRSAPREDWEAQLLAAKRTPAPTAEGDAEVTRMLMRLSRSNPTKLRPQGTAIQLSRPHPPSPAAAAAASASAPIAPPSAADPGPPSRTVGTAAYSNCTARATPSGFRQALHYAHSHGSRLSAASIPSAGGAVHSHARLEALRTQAASPAEAYSIFDPID